MAQFRLPRFKRKPDLVPDLRLTERDMEILRFVSWYRFLTSAHILKLISGSRQQILRRLHRLFHRGMLSRPPIQLQAQRPGNRPLIYGLTNKGSTLLGDKTDWNSRNRECRHLFLQHTLLVADVMVAIESACRQAGHVALIRQGDINANLRGVQKRKRFSWNVSFRHKGTNCRIGIVPDQIFGLKENGKDIQWYFLEADRGTMPVARKSLGQTSFLKKALGYHQTWEQQIHFNKFGLRNFRVLCVSPTRPRIESIKAICPRTNGLFWPMELSRFSQHPDRLELPGIQFNPIPSAPLQQT